MIEEWLFAHLTVDATVSALVVARVFPGVAPQSVTPPFITYTRISTPRIRSLGGPSGIAQPRFQIDAWAETYSGARAVANAVRVALDGFSGRHSDGMRVRAVSAQDEREDYEAETKLYRVSADFFIHHDE